MTARWTVRPEGSNWGDFGADDQIGRLNLLTPERVRRAVAEVREGRVFCLSMPLDYPGGSYHDLGRKPPRLHPVVRGGRIKYNNRGSDRHSDVSCDDWVELYTQFSTQWDALCHIGSAFDADGDGVAETVYYNGYRGGEHIPAPAVAEDDFAGARVLGIENMAETCVQGRGVMIDLRAHCGDERRAVGYDELMAIMDKDGVKVAEGDLVCLHTGFADRLVDAAESSTPESVGAICTVLDGSDKKLHNWITASGLAALISDNVAVEQSSSVTREMTEPGPVLPLHEHCLFKLGVPLGELWHLSELAAWLRESGRTRFLLTAPPLRMPGAVGSPATPVATV